jgi:tryptophan-rich sensory protein
MNPKYLSLAAFLLLVVIAAAIGGQFEGGSWYFWMSKPDWAPQAWLFAVGWSLVYLLTAMAAWMIWETGTQSRNGALIWWLMQLGLTAAWFWLFFGLHRPGWSMVEMLLLIAVVLMCIRAFSLLSRTAAALMLPFFLWLLFAWFLNFRIWTLNGGGLGSIL